MNRTERTLNGTLYLLWAEGTSAFKVGFTRGSVDVRAKQVEGSCPFPIRIQGEKPGTLEDEKALHARLARFRSNREWFLLPEPQVWKLLVWFGTAGGAA